MLQNNPVLKSKINDLWNKFWSGGISNPLSAIEQITYLLFMKQLYELDVKRQADAEFEGQTYESMFAGKFKIPGMDMEVDKKELRWDSFRRMTPENLLPHIQQKVFPFLKELNGEDTPFSKYMKNAVFIIEKPSLLWEAISVIDEIYKEIERDSIEGGQTFQDIQGDVYEYLLNEIAQAGKNGQFRTPRHIIKLIAELVDPQLYNRIADPACGTGGFLVGAYQYIVSRNSKDEYKKVDEDGFTRASVSVYMDEKVKEAFQKNLQGYDIDITMVRLGLMNLIMHGIDKPQIEYMDTLSKGYEEESKYDIVMANPPFTGSIDKGGINESLKLGTTKTELLFIERIFNMLRVGGTAGVIVPQGVLFGSGKTFVEARKLLIEKSELKAVITMPSGVFKPYAGVSTAILIFTKGSETEKVWFYEMTSDGYSLDDRRNKLEGYGDLQNIVEKYKSRNSQKESDRKEKSFFIPKVEIIAENYDLSMSKYKEEAFEEVEYEKPEVFLAKLKSLEKEINEELIGLEGMVG